MSNSKLQTVDLKDAAVGSDLVVLGRTSKFTKFSALTVIDNSVVQKLATFQVSYFGQVEDIRYNDFFHWKENTYGSSIAIRFGKSLRGFSFTNLCDVVSLKAIDVNDQGVA